MNLYIKISRFYLFILIALFLFTTNLSFSQDFSILPESVNDDKVRLDVEAVGNVHKETNDNYKSVWDKYKEISTKEERSLGDRMASGIISWDTILEYVVYLVKFLSQIGLLIGAIMIIYAGYQYATNIIGGDPAKGKSAISRAIIGVVVITFSYAIIKVLTNMFL